MSIQLKNYRHQHSMLHDNYVLAGLRESKFCLDLTSLSCSPQALQFGQHQELALDLLQIRGNLTSLQGSLCLLQYRQRTQTSLLHFYLDVTCPLQNIFSRACFHFLGGTKVLGISRPLLLLLDCSAFPAPVALCLVILTRGQETNAMLSLTTFLKSLFPFAALHTEIFLYIYFEFYKHTFVLPPFVVVVCSLFSWKSPLSEGGLGLLQHEYEEKTELEVCLFQQQQL